MLAPDPADADDEVAGRSEAIPLLAADNEPDIGEETIEHPETEQLLKRDSLPLEDIPLLRDNIYRRTLPLDHSATPVKKLYTLPYYHPNRSLFRYCVLVVACLFSIGSYFAYDSIGVVQKGIEEAYNITPTQFNLLYSIYSFPNIVLPFIGGYLLDRIGLPIGTLGACVCVATGSTLVAVSSISTNFPLMLFGRFLFGMGAEISYVAQNTICCVWFRDRQLALAMSLTVSAGRLGSFFTFNANAYAVKQYGDYSAALWFGAVMCLLSLFAGVAYFALHQAAQTMNKQTESTMAVENPTFEKISLKEVIHFPAVYWLVVFICTIFYTTIFPFTSLGTKFLTDSYNYPEDRAAWLISLLPLSALFLSPIFGWVVDKIAKRAFIVSAGLGVLCLAFTWLYFGQNPIPSIVVLGIVFSCVPAAIWPCVPLIIREEYTGTAFGLLSGVLNTGLTLVYQFVTEESEILLFIILAACGLLVSIGWNVMDIKHGGVVNYVNPKKYEPPLEGEEADIPSFWFSLFKKKN